MHTWIQVASPPLTMVTTLSESKHVLKDKRPVVDFFYCKSQKSLQNDDTTKKTLLFDTQLMTLTAGV